MTTTQNQHKTAPSFLGRIGLLLRMEWCTQGRNTLFFLLALLGALVGLTMLLHIGDELNPLSVKDRTHFDLWPLTLVCVAFYVFRIVQGRVNKSDTVTYTLIPASATAKFVVILIEGILALLVAAVVNQIAYTIEVLLYPAVLEASYYAPYIWQTSAGYGWFSSGFLDLYWPGAVILFNVLSAGIYFAVSIRKLTMATVAFLLTMGGETILFGILTSNLNLYGEDLFTALFFGSIGLCLFVLSFINLQRRQLK